MLYEALKAPLPDGWEAVNVEGYGDIVFYHSKKTNLTYEDHPIDGIYR